MAPVAITPTMVAEASADRPASRNDVHLRSMREVTGYSLTASDGEIGKVEGFLVEDRTWRIREMAVEAGHWYSGKEVFVRPESIRELSYDNSTVFVDLSREEIRASPRHAVVPPAV